MKHFKLRTDLTIEVGGKKLYRIEATEDLESHNVKKGDLGGFVEKEDNLSGKAWVSGDALVSGKARVDGKAWVSGNALVTGNARVTGDARVYGDIIKKTNDLINITSNVCSYNITITPAHIKIGCQFHSKTAWFRFNDDQIRKMDGEEAVNWWKIWKPILKTICENLEEK